MSKAQTDIRTTSYDALSARPDGYVGTIEDALAQIRAEPETLCQGPRGRTELRMFLGVPPKHLSVSGGPSLEDDHVEYGAPSGPGPYSLAYAESRFPDSFRDLRRVRLSLNERFEALRPSQHLIYEMLRERLGVMDALARAEAYPYPAPDVA